MRPRSITQEATIPYVRADGAPSANHLIVTFPKLHPSGAPPTTNLITALEPLNAHRLCIGSDWHNFVGPARAMAGTKTAAKLIRGEAKRLGIPRENVVAVGSSMGGVCALFIGFAAGAGRIVAGAAPVLMGAQLESFATIDGPSKPARDAAGHFIELAENGDGRAVRFLDRLILKSARRAAGPTMVDLFVSPTDRSHEATRWLERALAGDPLVEARVTLGEYRRHGDIRAAFVPYVLGTLGPMCGLADEAVRSSKSA